LIESSTSIIVGYVDYDRGYLAFIDTYGITSVVVNYLSMNFANESGEIANILLSPYDNTIMLADNEYPVLNTLSLEVDFE